MPLNNGLPPIVHDQSPHGYACNRVPSYSSYAIMAGSPAAIVYNDMSEENHILWDQPIAYAFF